MGRSRGNAPNSGIGASGIEAGGVDPAAEAGLVYTSDEEPGIRRVRKGKQFQYISREGTRIRDQATLDRIRSLAIPPAWEQVWISTRPRGHLQATGRDARGRKQHRYPPRWREMRDGNKLDRLPGFARAIPRTRRRAGRALGRGGLPKQK